MNSLGRVLLQEVQEICGLEDAVIAGGFVRDHILGGPFKDVDIFYEGDRSHLPTVIEELSSRGFGNAKTINAIYKRQNPEINWVLDCTWKDTIPVQIVCRNPSSDMMTSLLNDFDFGINEVIWDGEQIIRSSSFNDDKSFGWATLKNVNNDPQRLLSSVDKFHRLKEKYPYLQFRTTLDLRSEKQRKENNPGERKQQSKSGLQEFYDTYAKCLEYANGIAEQPAAGGLYV